MAKHWLVTVFADGFVNRVLGIITRCKHLNALVFFYCLKANNSSTGSTGGPREKSDGSVRLCEGVNGPAGT